MKANTFPTVIITGGTKGIGAAIAALFYEQGYFVVVAARTDNGLAKRLGPRAMAVTGDVRKKSAHAAFVKAALKHTARVDVYINCAGLSQWSPLERIDEKFLNDILDTNLKGAFFGCQAAAAVLPSGGCIINMSSLAGKRGSANNSAYCMSKFAVTGLTQSLSKELGPRGIRVNAVCPVYVSTEGVMAALKSKFSPAKGMDVKKYLSTFAQEQSALGRLPTEGDVAQACLFLASTAAGAITGQSINVDCGVLPQ